jgi:hypothetical protein
VETIPQDLFETFDRSGQASQIFRYCLFIGETLIVKGCITLSVCCLRLQTDRQGLAAYRIQLRQNLDGAVLVLVDR